MPTTTTLAPCVLVNTAEDDLVCKLQRAINSLRVYHFSVYRQIDPNAAYPCVVYERANDVPMEPELDDGDSGCYQADFSVFVLTTDGQTLRDWANAIQRITGLYTSNGFIQVSDDVEEYDVPIEMQNDGVMQTKLQVSISREGK